MDPDRNGRFSIPDYVVFGVSVLASFGIGIYSSFAGGSKGKTTRDFYFGNHDMNIVAVALSLTATFLSAVGLLGLPSEIYRNGITYSVILIAETIGGIIGLVLFIPFFYQLRLTSVYEYFEHRFNQTIRRCASALYVVNMMLYMSIVLYAPALALSQASGLPIWVSIITSGFVCTIYTSLGGMKAVIWTDAFQMIVMLVGIFIILIHGTISAGGPAKIFEANLNSGRLSVSFDPDPTIQSFWALAVGGIFTVLPFTLNQSAVQRYLSVKNQRSAQKMMAMKLPLFMGWLVVLIVAGVIMFAYYEGCDPLLAGRIERGDQMMLVFVADVLGYLQGLPGLFTAVVYSATLSTVSSGVNSVAVVITEDFIKPLHYLRTKSILEDLTVMRVIKALSFLIGFTTVGLAFASSAMGRGLVQFCMTIEGMCGGPMIGLFFCGMMLSYCNSKGAAAGVLSGLIVTFWLGIGSIVAGTPKLPLPINADFCPSDNSTTLAWVSNYTTLFVEQTDAQEISATTMMTKSGPVGVNWIYGISYQWYGLIGFLVTVTVATVVSFATGRQDSSKIPDRFFLYNLRSNRTDSGWTVETPVLSAWEKSIAPSSAQAAERYS